MSRHVSLDEDSFHALVGYPVESYRELDNPLTTG